MDGLSVASGIAGLISLADVVVRRLIQYVGAVRDAKDEISALLLQTSNLLGVLQSLKLLAEQYHCEKASYVQTIHIHSCFSTLEQLRSVLGQAFPSTHQSKFENIKTKLHWPITKVMTGKLITELEMHRSTLGLALSADSFASLLKMLDCQNEIRNAIGNFRHDTKVHFDKLEAYFTNQDRRNILQYFEKLSPHMIQATNLKILQLGTGVWFLKC